MFARTLLLSNTRKTGRVRAAAERYVASGSWGRGTAPFALVGTTRKLWPPERGWTGGFLHFVAPRPVALALLTTFACASSFAQTVPQLLAAVSGTTQYGGTAVSPDGHYVAWTVNLRSKDNTATRNSEIFLLDLAKPGATAQKFSQSDPPHQAKSLAWSPDSKQLAFLSDGDKSGSDKSGQLQLYVGSVDSPGKPAHKITSLTGFLDSVGWAPDGKTIAILFTENAPRAGGPLEPSTKDSGVVEEHIYEQRLTLVDPHSGKAKPISPDDLYVYEYDWAPDSSRLAFTAASGNGDNNWWVAQLYTISVASGESAASGDIKQVFKAPFQIARPRWSPDGKQIALIGGLMSDEGSTGGDIYAVPASGESPAHNLTPQRKSSPSDIRWLSSGKILFAETVNGGTAVSTLDATTRVAETLWTGEESLKAGDGVISASTDGGMLASIRSSWTLAPEVWAGPLNQWAQRTHANDAVKPLWGRAESLHWRSDDSDVQGWLLYPLNYDPAKKYPMVVSVHGGPAAAKKPAWPGSWDMTLLSSQGYFVFFPNPRGSFGSGEEFTRNNVQDFGQGDLRDILLGLDTVVKTLPVDPERLGIAGWSYGGYMTMWAVTQTHRFRAAVAGAGISDWQSYYGENLIDQWMIPYFGTTVYNNPSVYARSSPINFIRNVQTPTLIAVGDSDAECPAPQSYEFWHALKTLGVKTQLVVYANEGHAIRKPADVRDLLERTIAWFDQNLASKPVTP